MKLSQALAGVQRLFLETAPVIYHVQGNVQYQSLTQPIFTDIQAGRLLASTSSITLAECLVLPYQINDPVLAQQFRSVIQFGSNVAYLGVDPVVEKGAELSARYQLKLPDALQVAVSLSSNCQAFLTNDRHMKRVQEIPILVLDELEA